MSRVRVITAALMATLAFIAVLTLSDVAPQANASGSGGAWTQMSPANSPMARSLASMAYDAATQQLVLFGGFGSDLNELSDTWTWSGTNWTQLSPATSPSARDEASMAYDPATQQLVLFGGLSRTALGDTWMWSGTTWTQHFPATSPPARYSASMAYDAATQQLVLFGGEGSTNQDLSDTWTWSGTNWTQLSPATNPPARAGSSMAYDASAHQLVLFGGSDGSTIYGDTWTWSGTTWTQQFPATSPSARFSAAVASYSPTGQIILFGGIGSNGFLDDTWTWNTTRWTQLGAPTSPHARAEASMAYDDHSDQIVLFGGTSRFEIFGDTWSWNGTAPVFTSADDDTTPSGRPFAFTVTAAGAPTPTMSPAFGSNLPSGVTLTDHGDGTATLAGTSSVTPGTYTFTMEAFNGLSPNATQTFTLTLSGNPYSPLVPVRICDTRPGNPSGLSGAAAQCNGMFNVGSTIPARGTESISVAGTTAFGVPSDATAVVLNVTAVNPAAPGYLTVFPSGATQPLASNLNYTVAEVVPNLVEVGIGSDGEVSIYSSAQSNVVVDLEGYVAPNASGGLGAGLYNPLSAPARICDTRTGNPSHLSGPDAQCNGVAGGGERLKAAGTLWVQVAGNNGIPAGATAAVLNVTAVNPSTSGYLTVYPQGAAQPFTANVNYIAGQTTGNRVIVPLSTTGTTPGRVSIYSKAAADVVVDVSGYYSAANGSGTGFSAEPAPVRICDTRPGNPSGLSGGADQCDGKTLGPAGSDTIQVAGLAAVPSNARAVVVNLTAVFPTADTFLTVFPGPTKPFVSDLNPAAGDVKGNLTVATLSTSGTTSIYNNAGSVDVVVDVLGWYS